MLLTITTTYRPATDLGFLLHKNPGKVQDFDLSFGRAHVFYPEASEDRCTVALVMDIDTIGLVRNRHRPSGDGFSLDQYVNDRPYVASSFLSVAMNKIFRTAMQGTCLQRPDLVETKIPLIAKLPVVPCKGGEDLLKRLFEPLGYSVVTESYPLETKFPDWGQSKYYSVTIEGCTRLQDTLSHLYVLIPVLDDDKHYWVGDDEVEKLLRNGEQWLSGHPERELIVDRYLKHRKNLTREALSRLLDEDQIDPDEDESAHTQEEEAIERKMSLNEQRLGTVVAILKNSGASRVLDLGCGEGKLIDSLLKERAFKEIVGIDVSHRSLEVAVRKLNLDRMPSMQRERINLLHGSLMYRDKRLHGFDAAAVIEVIEHLDPPRLAAFERVLFEFARPATVVLSTPNVEYNVRFETLPAGKLRHKDHRFEWSREEFKQWSGGICKRFGYSVRFLSVGDDDSEVGPPTQMAVFSLAHAGSESNL